MTTGEQLVARYDGAPMAAHLLARDIDAAVREAVAAERERAAAVADREAIARTGGLQSPCCRYTAEAIADAIRGGNSPDELTPAPGCDQR